MLIKSTEEYDETSHQVGLIQHGIGNELAQLNAVLPELSNVDAFHTKVLMSEWINSMKDMIQQMDEAGIRTL